MGECKDLGKRLVRSMLDRKTWWLLFGGEVNSGGSITKCGVDFTGSRRKVGDEVV